MGYLGRPTVITRVLMRGRQEGQSKRRCNDGSRGQRRRPLEAEMGQEGGKRGG